MFTGNWYYNAERWIAEAIQSCLDQTYRPIEIIVIDDGSTDGSLEIIQSFGDAVRWETGPNWGGNAARNCRFDRVKNR
jgi:glycosyltransferase involved in cell wall biosynthesis